MKKMMQTCYPSLQVYYTKFALKSQSNFEDSKKTANAIVKPEG